MRHGTAWAVIRYRCMCDDCWAAYRAHNRLKSEKHRRLHGVPVRGSKGRTCGTRSSYVHGCRCADCRRAEREYRADYRRRVAS